MRAGLHESPACNSCSKEEKALTGAVIVATGLAVSPGNPKQLMAARGRTYTESLVDIYLDAGIDTIVVITGAHDHLLRQALANTTAVCIQDENYQSSSLLDSARIGIRYLSGKCDRIFVSPLETTLTNEKTLLKLLSKQSDVVLPVRDGEDCSPILLSSKIFNWCLLYNGRRGISGAWKSLVTVGEATVSRIKEELCSAGTEHSAHEDSDYLPAYRPVINWV